MKSGQSAEFSIAGGYFDIVSGAGNTGCTFTFIFNEKQDGIRPLLKDANGDTFSPISEIVTNGEVKVDLTSGANW